MNLSRRSFFIGFGATLATIKLAPIVDIRASYAKTQLPLFDRRHIYDLDLCCPFWKPGQPDVGFVVRFPHPRNPEEDFLTAGMNPRSCYRWHANHPLHELIYRKDETLRFIVEPDCPSLEAHLYYDGYRGGERRGYLEKFTWKDGQLVSQSVEPLDDDHAETA